MMPSWFPTDVWLQSFICVALAAITLLLIRSDRLRQAALAGGIAALLVTRWAAAKIIWLFDKTMPVDGRSGRLPRSNFSLWTFLNLAVVSAWIATGTLGEARAYTVFAAAAAATFALINLLLLGASYWAVRETIEVTNGEVPRNEARFPETSASRNVTFVLGTALLLIAQIAVVIDWAQQAEGMYFVAYDGSIGLRYANFLLATIDALPLAGFYVAPLHEHVALAPSFAGEALHRTLAALGSILIVGTALGLIQQRLVFRRMVDRLVDAPAFEPALLARLMNAPDAIKGYISAAFRSETDDQRRLKLAQLAIKRGTFSFPRTFAANYSHYGSSLREAGTRLVADFIEAQRPAFWEASLVGLFDVCDWGVHKGFRSADDRRRMARILVPAFEIMHDRNADAARTRIASVMGQRVLSASLPSVADPGLRIRSARLLIKADTCYPIPAVLRALPNFDEPTARELMRSIAELLRTAQLPKASREASDLFEDIAQAIQSAEGRLPAPVAGSIAGIRKALRQRRRATRRAENALPETETPVGVAAIADQPQPG